jgi:hypothetical protein
MLVREFANYRSLQRSASIPRVDEFGIRDRDDGRKMIAQQREQLATQLRAQGFAGIEDFERIHDEFLAAFQREAMALALNMLARYEQLLQREHGKYQNASNAVALYQALGGARKHHQQAVEHERRARVLQFDPDLHRPLPAHFELNTQTLRQAAEFRRLAGLELGKFSGAHPLLKNKDFNRWYLLEASQEAVQSVMLTYIRTHQKNIVETRKNLSAHPALIFKLNVVLKASYEVQDISPGSTCDLIIQEHIRVIQGKETSIKLALGVLAIAAGLLTLGGGTIAVVAGGVSLGLGTLDVLVSLQQYELESAAHGSQLLSDDPSLVWVVVAIVGAGLDLSAAVVAIKAMKPAITAFNKSGDLIQFERSLKALPVEHRLRSKVLDAARAEQQARRVARQQPGAPSSSDASGFALFGKKSPPPSGPLSPELRRMYLRELDSKWFRTKLSVYAKLTGKGPIDWDGLVQMVKTAEFKEYANLRQMIQSGGYAGYDNGKLILGMTRLIRKIPVIGRSSIQHELVHVFQQLSMGVMTREGAIPYLEVIQLEVAANLFGSPAVILTVIGLVSAYPVYVVIDSGSISIFQE